MTPYVQKLSRKDQPTGDCYRTALGCLLDIPPEQIPHFYDKSVPVCGIDRARQWLRERGFGLVVVNFEAETVAKALRKFGDPNPNEYYLLVGRSRSGPWSHIVVCKGRKIIHDPNPNNHGKKRPGIKGPRYGNYFEVHLITQVGRTGIFS